MINLLGPRRNRRGSFPLRKIAVGGKLAARGTIVNPHTARTIMQHCRGELCSPVQELSNLTVSVMPARVDEGIDPYYHVTIKLYAHP